MSSVDVEAPESFSSCSDDEIDEIDDTVPIEDIVQQRISKNMRSLTQFLTKFIVEQTDKRANITNVIENKSYAIPDAELEEFYGLIEAIRREGRSIHFVEHQETSRQSHSGISLDFNIYQREKESQITHSTLGRIVSTTCNILKDFLNLADHATDESYHLRAFALQSPAPVRAKTRGENDLYRDSFRIVFPEVLVNTAFKRFVVQEILDRGTLKMVFKGINMADDACSCISRASATSRAFLLGNSAGDVKTAMQLTHIWDACLDLCDGHYESTKLNVQEILGSDMNLTYELSLTGVRKTIGGKPVWLPKQQLNYSPHLESRVNAAAERAATYMLTEKAAALTEDDLSIVNINNPKAAYLLSLANLLDSKFSADLKLWTRVVQTIANCGITEDYRAVAAEFSKRGPWSPEIADKAWLDAVMARGSGSPLTIGSLRHWAKSSSPQAYAELEKENYGNILRRSTYEGEGVVNQAAVSRVAHAMCGDRFAVDVEPNAHGSRPEYHWFEFITPGQSMKKGQVYKWRREAAPDNLHLFIGDHLPKIFQQVGDNIKTRKEDAADPAEKKYWECVDSKFKTSKNHLGDDRFQNGVINQARYRFRVHGFLDEMDSYEDVIGVGNGIVKLGPNPKLIRGFHEYKISKFTKTEYEAFDPANNHYQRTLLKAFRDIYPEEDVFHFMMMHLATGVDARESSCIIVLQVGGGQNGKTFVAKMAHNTLGEDYCAAGKSALLTSNMERGESANSAQMQQMGKRYFYLDEFNKYENVNTARLKAMVTPGWQSGRDLNVRQCNFKNTSNPMAMSNFDFGVDSNDHGTWRRIYYYRNKISFRKVPNPNNPYEKQADDRFITQYTNDPAYQRAMLAIMVHYQAVLCRDYGGDLKNIPVPTIERETEIFRNKQDSLNKFITSMLVKSPEAAPIGLSTLCTRYITWYESTIKRGSNLTSASIESDFDNSRIAPDLKTLTGGFKQLTGYRLKSHPEEGLGEGEESLMMPQLPPCAADLSKCRPPSLGYDVDEICGLREKIITQDQWTAAADELGL